MPNCVKLSWLGMTGIDLASALKYLMTTTSRSSMFGKFVTFLKSRQSCVFVAGLLKINCGVEIRRVLVIF